MTRIDFHSNVGDSLLYACRLIRKAYQAGQPTIVLAEPARLRAFDEQLWTFCAARLRAALHGGHALAAQTPIVLAVESRRCAALSGAAQSRRRRCRRSSRASKDCWKWSVTHRTNWLRAANAIASIAIAAML